MTQPIAFKAASGITGLISRVLGVHPLIAAGLKYVGIGAVAFGFYQLWKHNVIQDAVKPLEDTIETQAGAIGTLGEGIADNAEDSASKGAHVADAGQSEYAALQTLILSQTSRMAALQEKLDDLETLAETDRPDLLVPWPDGMQRRGGYDLNRSAANDGLDPRADRGDDADETRLSGARGQNPERREGGG